MSKLGRIARAKLNEVKWKGIDRNWRKMELTPVTQPISNTTYTIGITTYIERLDTYLIPLIQRLNHLFADTQLIVAINGYHQREKQEAYLKKINGFLATYSNVICFDYLEPQGLCTLWNQMVLRCSTERLFIFNEDLQIAPQFRTDLEQSQALDHPMSVINKSYSHFMVTKALMREVGWFDERFPGIGYEDHDFEIRMALKGHTPFFAEVEGLKNDTAVPEDWSWGNDHDVIFGKYSGPNGEHYFKKWSFSDEPKENYTWVRILQGYAQLQEGMETPDFHPDKLN